MSVNEFVAWALSHAKRASVPNGAVLCVDPQNVGRDGEWEYLYGTTGRRVTQSLLDERYANYYSRKGWTRAEYDRATSGWIERGVTVCDCQGLEDYYSGSDTFQSTHPTRGATAKTRKLMQKTSSQSITMHLM